MWFVQMDETHYSLPLLRLASLVWRLLRPHWFQPQIAPCVNLEKAFDRVPRDVLWWALRQSGVDEWIVVWEPKVFRGSFNDGMLCYMSLERGQAQDQ